MTWLYALPAPALLLMALALAVSVALVAQTAIHRRFDRNVFVAHNEVAGIMVVVVASVYAVLLGFMTVVSWEHFQESRAIVVSEADATIDSWHTAVGLPAAVRGRVRADMTRYAQIMVDQEWGAMKRGGSVAGAGMLGMDAMDATGGFTPADAGQANAQSATMAELGTMHDARQRRIASNEGGLSGFEWLVLVLGAALITGFCWLFGGTRPRVQMLMTATVVTMLVSTLVLLFELQFPFRSGIGIDNTTWVGAVGHIHEMMTGTMPGMRG